MERLTGIQRIWKHKLEPFYGMANLTPIGPRLLYSTMKLSGSPARTRIEGPFVPQVIELSLPSPLPVGDS